MAVRNILLVGLLLGLVAGTAWSQGAPGVGQVDPDLAGSPAVAATTSLPVAAGADTIRTNLWLVQALMGEIAAEAAGHLGPPPARVRLVPLSNDPRTDIFLPVVTDVLAEMGYELYMAQDEPAKQADVDYVFAFSIQNIRLDYPDVGRTLGIWRRWVDRDLRVAVMAEITAEETGRLLLSQRLERRFGDRIDDDDLAGVESDAYDFTNAEVNESGWQRRAEELVVLGTLAGLVAIYFANTGD
ncbi:hypothetical protein KDM41_12750 [bacterium]|nr:hypothetical protein [bacterium]